MNDILVLPHHEAMKIAAGEVIERPANIIKELLENGIDASATIITIHLSQAGKEQIIITDNGTGMTPENARKSFLQHATSKITSVNDLDTIQTFGFRGEALATIAAVSTIIITTRDKSHDEAIKITLHHGKIKQEETASHQVGTTINITDLFAEIPARKKFLKTNETELNTIINIFQASVLLQSNIHFKLYHNNKLLYNCPPTNDHIDRVAQLWGPQLAESLIQLPKITKDDLTIFGSITQSQYHRYNRNQIFTFVNNRWIKNSTIARAVLKAYQNILPPQKYPAAFIFITLPQNQIDVNIHPKKEEIRFLQPRIVEQQIEKVAKTALTDFVSQHISNSSIQNFSMPKVQPFNVDRFNITPTVNIESIDRDFFNKENLNREVSNMSYFNTTNIRPTIGPFSNKENTGSAFSATQHQTIFEQQAATISESQEKIDSPLAIIGQYHKTYILIEKNDNLIAVDQHAAHERIIYESLIKNFEKIETISLLFPQIIQLSEEQISIIEPYFSLLKKHGISIETFSKTEVIIQETPVYLKSHMLTQLVQNIVTWLVEEKKFDPERVHAHIRATIACRSSHQAGDVLNQDQMQNLIKALQKTNNNNSCPHGRPTLWVISKKEIDKQFKRDYQSQKQYTFNCL